MTLKLERPLVFFDLETTGVKVGSDRIVQVAAVKRHPDGKRSEWKTFVNPGIPIPKASTEIHGITNDIVAKAPSFDEVGPKLARAIDGCDLAGFNVKKFDWPFLLAEFDRVGLQVERKRRFVDVMLIFHSFVRRDLSAATQHYLGREHADAHDALADVLVTEAILDAQLVKHPEVPRTAAEIDAWLFPVDPDAIDEGGRFRWVGGVPVVAFGKHAGTPLAKVDPGFLRWMQDAGFIGEDAKAIAREALSGRFPTKQSEKAA